MQTDGQLYKVLHKGEREFPPETPPDGPRRDDSAVCPNTVQISEKRERRGLLSLSSVGRDELLLLGIIFLLISDSSDTDIPIVLALVYILISG